MLKQRIITALVLATLVLLALFAESNIYWRILINVAIITGLWEWLRFCQISNTVMKMLAYASFAAALYVTQSGIVPLPTLIIFGCLLWLGLIAFTLTEKLDFLHQPLCKLAIGILAFAISALLVIELRAIPNGPLWILCLMISVFSTDIGAYFVGRRFGKTKLAPTISPGKTVEGLLGGLVFMLLIFVPVIALNFEASSAALLLTSIFIAVLVSVVGDLFMSKMKRFAGIKDSSQILPGHGGILDRVDSLLAAAPLFSFGLLMLGYLG